MSLATLPFAGAPSVRVRRPESDGRLLVVVQDVFTHIGKVSTKAVARRIDSATDKLERVVRLVTIRERGNDLKLATLTDALDLLIQINVPAARALRHQLIQLGKHVLAGDPDGTVADACAPRRPYWMADHRTGCSQDESDRVVHQTN